jgi:hypothetical protein
MRFRISRKISRFHGRFQWKRTRFQLVADPSEWPTAEAYQPLYPNRYIPIVIVSIIQVAHAPWLRPPQAGGRARASIIKNSAPIMGGAIPTHF